MANMRPGKFSWTRGVKTQDVRVGGRRVVAQGLPSGFWTDLHHHAMVAAWPMFFAALAVGFVVLNFLFALLYALGDDPVANARPGNFLDLFFFSVETLGTVGYGDMHPRSVYGHIVATSETFIGVSSLAVVAGLVFTRFSRPRARLVFASNPVLTTHEGAKTLMIRFANARHNMISDATAKLWMVGLEQTMEGSSFRKFRRLALARDENPTFALTWTIMHMVDETSPLRGWSAEDLVSSDRALIITLSGFDETSNQFVHARREYSTKDVLVGHDYQDILRNDEAGVTWLDYTKFHATSPAQPS
jgi:inward rectifier potassium channel